MTSDPEGDRVVRAGGNGCGHPDQSTCGGDTFDDDDGGGWGDHERPFDNGDGP